MNTPTTLRLIRAAGILRRNYNGGGGRWDGRRMMSTTVKPSRVSPWLMLPPTFDKSRGGMVYNFYSLADDEVFLFSKHGGGADPRESPDDDALVVGSSHGWLALMNRRNNDLFLSNPLSRRHIKLPPIDPLPHPEFNLRRGRGCVSKVILSASPDDGECRAMMSFGPGDRLAFCCPGRSKTWTPIGELFVDGGGDRFARVYEDFVYSSRRDLFNCLTLFGSDDFTLEDWDLRLSDSPRINWIQREKLPARSIHSLPEIECLDDGKEEVIRRGGWIMKHLAYAAARDELFLIFRFIKDRRTIGFIAAKVEKEGGGKMRLVGCSLEGLALFVGTNHSFAAAAEEFPHLKGNSIYFTDNKFYGKSGGGDVGIFNCGDATFSSCYHFKNTILSPPIWFTPVFP